MGNSQSIKKKEKGDKKIDKPGGPLLTGLLCRLFRRIHCNHCSLKSVYNTSTTKFASILLSFFTLFLLFHDFYLYSAKLASLAGFWREKIFMRQSQINYLHISIFLTKNRTFSLVERMKIISFWAHVGQQIHF